MMGRLYRLLLRLYPARVRREFGAEMIAVFEEASAAERSRGAGAYVRFCAREAGGLVANLVRSEDFMKHRRLVVHGCLAGLLIGGVLAFAWGKRPYTSTAILHVVPAMIPDRFVPSQTIGVDSMLPNLVQTVLSRGNLSNVVRAYDLYPDERKRMPLEDVIELMRKAIQIGPHKENVVPVSFRYSDAKLAQKVTMTLVDRMMEEQTRFRRNQSSMTLQFLRDAAVTAAADWENSLTKVRETQSRGQVMDRVRLDSEIARQRYESLSAKVAEAEMIRSMEERRQGANLEILDAAAVPTVNAPSVLLWGFVGALVGSIIGWIVSLLPLARRRTIVAGAS